MMQACGLPMVRRGGNRLHFNDVYYSYAMMSGNKVDEYCTVWSLLGAKNRRTSVDLDTEILKGRFMKDTLVEFQFCFGAPLGLPARLF